jgi:hypothetical protein
MVFLTPLRVPDAAQRERIRNGCVIQTIYLREAVRC